MDLGIFIPIGNNGWIISMNSPQYKPSFRLNRTIAELLVIAGTAFLLMHVSVNEYIHSFWQTEEIFSHPAHWPFVLYFYVAAAVFSVWFQTLPRIYELIGQARQESRGRGGSQ